MTKPTVDTNAARTVADLIDRIDRNEGKLNAVARQLSDIAMADAEHCDAMTKVGNSLGPLHGVPFVIKDIVDISGVHTMSGSLTQKQTAIRQQDATVVAKLRAAGAIPLVKTNTVEFAIGGWGTNQTVGTPSNPWSSEQPMTPGGSSSGTGVLVGAGLAPAGLGTDTGGSVRIPAAFCGCVGLKTSIGSVSRSGVTPLSDTLDTVGPLCNSVSLAARFFAAMHGVDPNDPTTLAHPGTFSMAALDSGVTGLRLGRIKTSELSLMDDDVRESFDRAVNMLENAGAKISDTRLPKDLQDYQDAVSIIVGSEAYATYSTLVDDKDSLMAAPNRGRMKLGASVSASDLVTRLRQRQRDISEVEDFFGDCDAIIMPAAPTTAIAIEGIDEADMRCSLFTRFVNYLELSALVVPIDITAKGLPTSLQIIVRRFHDPLALRIGQAFEKERGDFPTPPGIS